jgi:hypothetical protein
MQEEPARKAHSIINVDEKQIEQLVTKILDKQIGITGYIEREIGCVRK